VSILSKVLQVIYLVKPLVRSADPYVLFSGGKDSLVTLHLVKRVADKNGRKVIAVHVDTTASIPDNLNYVRSLCEELEVELRIVKPRRDYFSLVKKWGFPTLRRRWCCYYLKIEPLKDFFSKQPDPKVVFDGIRATESTRRRNISQPFWHRHFRCYCYHPILYWSSTEVEYYIMKYKLPLNPLYDKGFTRASECWCPVFKTVEQFSHLKEHYPSFFNKLVRLESQMREGGSTLFKKGRRIYLGHL